MKYQVWIDNEITGPEKLRAFESEKDAKAYANTVLEWDAYIICQSRPHFCRFLTTPNGIAFTIATLVTRPWAISSVM